MPNQGKASSKKGRSINQIRTEQLQQVTSGIKSLETRLHELKLEKKRQLTILDSVSLGLYQEIDKLSKKAPAEAITDLVLTQLNDIIRESKQLADTDVYMQRLNEFVPAGDNPQHRDAVVVLRQIRQGLERFEKELNPMIIAISALLTEARVVEIALELYLDGETRLEIEELKQYEGVGNVPSSWQTGNYPTLFNFEKLDKMDVNNYFSNSSQL